MKRKNNFIPAAVFISAVVCSTVYLSGAANAASSLPSMSEVKSILLREMQPEPDISYDIDNNSEVDVFDYMTLKQKFLYPQHNTSQTVTTVRKVVVCDSMNRVLSKSGYKLADIGQSRQIVSVESDGMKCSVRLYEKNDYSWDEVRTASGIVGKNGVSKDKHEGDYRTPAGLFTFGVAFGTQNMNDLKMQYRRITENSYWVDDVSSPYYNQWVETSNVTFSSAEHLIKYPDAYKYAAAINYNTDPVIKNAGSAIFLHCAKGSYTAGCVAVPENDMLYILRWLDSSKNPMILICSSS
ncbi:MAG: L,D-transpeptidase family protein [Oscillospiraceae bacterium]|nr:L,D-transpeptidase family protein [Oscillospiraceae bacterium]